MTTQTDITYYLEKVNHKNAVAAYDGSQPVGYLVVKDGIIESIAVMGDYRKRGIATQMLAIARSAYGQIIHSTSRTKDGEKWANKVQ